MAEHLDGAAHELADDVCEDCGGLRVPNIDVALSALHTAETTGTKIPWCTCCPPCRKFSDGVLRVMVAAASPIDSTSHEDAL